MQQSGTMRAQVLIAFFAALAGSALAHDGDEHFLLALSTTLESSVLASLASNAAMTDHGTTPTSIRTTLTQTSTYYNTLTTTMVLAIDESTDISDDAVKVDENGALEAGASNSTSVATSSFSSTASPSGHESTTTTSRFASFPNSTSTDASSWFTSMTNIANSAMSSMTIPRGQGSSTTTRGAPFANSSAVIPNATSSIQHGSAVRKTTTKTIWSTIDEDTTVTVKATPSQASGSPQTLRIRDLQELTGRYAIL